MKSILQLIIIISQLCQSVISDIGNCEKGWMKVWKDEEVVCWKFAKVASGNVKFSTAEEVCRPDGATVAILDDTYQRSILEDIASKTNRQACYKYIPQIEPNGDYQPIDYPIYPRYIKELNENSKLRVADTIAENDRIVMQFVPIPKQIYNETNQHHTETSGVDLGTVDGRWRLRIKMDSETSITTDILFNDDISEIKTHTIDYDKNKPGRSLQFIVKFYSDAIELFYVKDKHNQIKLDMLPSPPNGKKITTIYSKNVYFLNIEHISSDCEKFNEYGYDDVTTETKGFGVVKVESFGNLTSFQQDLAAMRFQRITLPIPKTYMLKDQELMVQHELDTLVENVTWAYSAGFFENPRITNTSVDYKWIFNVTNSSNQPINVQPNDINEKYHFVPNTQDNLAVFAQQNLKSRYVIHNLDPTKPEIKFYISSFDTSDGQKLLNPKKVTPMEPFDEFRINGEYWFRNAIVGIKANPIMTTCNYRPFNLLYFNKMLVKQKTCDMATSVLCEKPANNGTSTVETTQKQEKYKSSAKQYAYFTDVMGNNKLYTTIIIIMEVLFCTFSLATLVFSYSWMR